MYAITQGNYHKAKLLIPKFSNFQFEQRNSDPVRDIKNYWFYILVKMMNKFLKNYGLENFGGLVVEKSADNRNK